MPEPDDGSFAWSIDRPFSRCPECGSQLREGERVTRDRAEYAYHTECLERWIHGDQ